MRIYPSHAGQIRLLTGEDLPAVRRLLFTSEYIYQRFTPRELPLLLEHYPAVGLFNGASLQSFLLSQTVNPPSAWISGFGVSWTASSAYVGILTSLLEQLSSHLLARGVYHLHYSGNDTGRDWLRPILLGHGFTPHSRLYAYDKIGFTIPTTGNQQVVVRPLTNSRDDMQALLNIENACFEDLWRYDATAFADIAATHPYFVLAELQGKVVGYQFNALENDTGYLIRIAVHPTFGSKGIGARLMAEAIRFFEREGAARILLNTQEENVHAHRLYEWFGFVRAQQTGFVLRKYL
jgi:ribosomal-protein-alanine N-acetyltransferase